MSVQALFVEPRGVYPNLLGAANCWDEARDARMYDGLGPVVAHPPCHLWVNMAAVNWVRYGRQRPAWYPGGTDGRCFASALAAVRMYGGVLEHPAGTHAWKYYGLPDPDAGRWSHFGWTDSDSPPAHTFAAVCEIWQSAYGHAARKRTWLLYCGDRSPFDLNWAREPGTHQIGWFDRAKPTLSKREASATPIAFALELVLLAEHSRGAL